MNKKFKTKDIYLLKLTRVLSLYKNYQNPNSDNWLDRIEELPKSEDLAGVYPAKRSRFNSKEFTLVTNAYLTVNKDINTDYLQLEELGELCIRSKTPLSASYKNPKVDLKTLIHIEKNSKEKAKTAIVGEQQ